MCVCYILLKKFAVPQTRVCKYASTRHTRVDYERCLLKCWANREHAQKPFASRRSMRRALAGKSPAAARTRIKVHHETHTHIHLIYVNYMPYKMNDTRLRSGYWSSSSSTPAVAIYTRRWGTPRMIWVELIASRLCKHTLRFSFSE